MDDISSAKSVDNSVLIKQARNEIFKNYGDCVTVENRAQSILKYGRNNNTAVGGSTIMTLPVGVNNETYVFDNLIDRISSDNINDAGKEIVIEGHFWNGVGIEFVSQMAIFDVADARIPVDLTTPLFRVHRAYNSDDVGDEWVGTIYVFEDDTVVLGIPSTVAKVHLMVRAGKQQSEKAAYTTASTEYLILTRMFGDSLKRGNAFADIEFEMRRVGDVFRNQTTFDPTKRSIDFNPYFIVPPNYDIRMVAYADQANSNISGGFQGMFADILEID